MSCNQEVKKLKKTLTLDFNQRPSQSKIQKFSTLVGSTISKSSPYNHLNKKCLLTTPDVEKLALSSPEVAELIKNYSQVGPFKTFTRADSPDEEKPSKEALALWSYQYHNINNNINNKSRHKTVTMTAISKLEKDTKPMQPINMADQEAAKLERKRLRNRIAASKCRQRKLEKISKLQKKADDLETKNNDLSKYIDIIKEYNDKLLMHINRHKELGCDLHDV